MECGRNASFCVSEKQIGGGQQKEPRESILSVLPRGSFCFIPGALRLGSVGIIGIHRTVIDADLDILVVIAEAAAENREAAHMSTVPVSYTHLAPSW